MSCKYIDAVEDNKLFPLLVMMDGQENLNKAQHHCVEPSDTIPHEELNEDIKPAVVPPNFRIFYEFIHELNDNCHIDFTHNEIISLVNHVDCKIIPDNCEQSFCAHDLKGQILGTDFSLNSIKHVDFCLPEKAFDVCPKNPPEKHHKRLTSATSLPKFAHSRSVLVKRKLSRLRLVIKLTSREYLALRYYDNTARCIVMLNDGLSTRNLKVLFSYKKSRLVVKGNCDLFDASSLVLLKLVRQAGCWWDQRKDDKKSKSSFPVSEDTESCLHEQPVKLVKAPSPERFSSNEPAGAASDVANVEATTLYARPLVIKCKDFPDCSNTHPDNCCKVEYIVKPSQHNLFIRADHQFDIVKKLNLKFQGVNISLLRKFAAFHILPEDGVDPQFAINAITELKRRCLSMDDIKKVLEDFKKPSGNNLDPSVTLCLKKVELKSFEKPLSNLKRMPQGELCKPLAKRSKTNNRERDDRRRQKQQQQSINQVITETYSTQPFHHYESLQEYGTSYCADKGANVYVGPSPNVNYSTTFETWQHGWPCSQWEPAPVCLLGIQFQAATVTGDTFDCIYNY